MLDYYSGALKKYRESVFDAPFSKNYYPGHVCSGAPLSDILNAYYDHDNKPWLYEKLLALKNKYDSGHLLHNEVSIPVK